MSLVSASIENHRSIGHQGDVLNLHTTRSLLQNLCCALHGRGCLAVRNPWKPMKWHGFSYPDDPCGCLTLLNSLETEEMSWLSHIQASLKYSIPGSCRLWPYLSRRPSMPTSRWENRAATIDLPLVVAGLRPAGNARVIQRESSTSGTQTFLLFDKGAN